MGSNIETEVMHSENNDSFGKSQPERFYEKSALLTVAWNADDWTFDALTAHYKTLVRYINFEDKGMILGYCCGTPAMTRRSRYPEKAYRLGKSL